MNDDEEFLEYVKDLVKRLFNAKMHLYLYKNINTRYISKNSWAMVSFLESLGFEKKKCLLKIPSWVWQNNKFTSAFIRGLFDTDGSIALKKNHGKYEFYPVISISLKDCNLIKSVASWIRSKGISVYTGKESPFDKRTSKRYFKYSLQINGYKGVRAWMVLIGTSNPKHKEKWERGDLNSRLRDLQSRALPG